MKKMYLIDGVQVTQKIWDRRQLFGENKLSRFTIKEIHQQIERPNK